MMIWLLLLLILGDVICKEAVHYELIQGDIRVVLDTKRNLRSLGTIGDNEEVTLWRMHYSNGAFEIPVRFDENDEIEGMNTITQSGIDSILSKMNNMETKLNNVIRFVTEFDEMDYPDGYLRIGVYTPGCWSYVGRLPTMYQPQVVNIGDGCDFTDSVEHELMHALGFFHEQARLDRDDHVVIHWTNIDQSKYVNFEKTTSIDSRNSPYDQRSVMHYSNYAFALDPRFETITARDVDNPIVGSALSMTHTDETQIRMLYRCENRVVGNYLTNCAQDCPCVMGEGECSGDSGCGGTLVCDQNTKLCSIPIPTSSPVVGAPTNAPTQTTPSPTSYPTVPPSQMKTTTNVGLIVALTGLGLTIVIASLFW